MAKIFLNIWKYASLVSLHKKMQFGIDKKLSSYFDFIKLNDSF